MPDPLMTMSEATPKTMPQATCKAMLPRALFAAGALALTFGVFAATAPAANAAPMQALPGLATPGLQVEEIGYKRRKYQQLYGSDYYVTDYYVAGSGNRVYRSIPGGNDEIRELQRLFPETNWPRSLRY